MREIPLSQGQVALVDDADFDWLNQWKWSAQKDSRSFYAFRKENSKPLGKTIYMHRAILGLGETKMQVDHKDFNGLNNQRENLRKCTAQQNFMYRRAFKNNKYSKHKGVRFAKKTGKWMVYVNCKYYGTFTTEEEAAKKRIEIGEKIQGEFFIK